MSVIFFQQALTRCRSSEIIDVKLRRIRRPEDAWRWIHRLKINQLDLSNQLLQALKTFSVTLQRENGSMLLERSPLPTADVDGEI